MSKLLNQYSMQLRKNTIPAVKVGEQVESLSIDTFKECQKNHTTFDVIFSYASKDGDLKATVDDIMVILKGTDLHLALPYYNSWIKDRFVGTPFTVSVKEIDEENKTVYVQSSRSGSSDNIRGRLTAEIQKELKKRQKTDGAEDAKEQEPLVVAGKIIQVTDGRAIVNLLGIGIMGIIYSRNWSTAYTRSLNGLCQKNEVYDFEILRQFPKKKDKSVAFELSRKNVGGDPWEMIPEEFCQKDSIINVECIEKPQNKTYWWGRSNLIKGIEIMGNFNSNLGNIMVSVTYKCKVVAVDKEKHMFKVVPFDTADEVSGDMKRAIRFIESKKTVK